MTNRPGSSAAARLASPTPSHWPTSASSSTAVWSPACAACVTSGPVSRSGSPPAACSRPCATGDLAEMSSRASRTRALPLAYCSQHPRLPHSQRWPPGTTCMCPNSPATPNRPRTSAPSNSSPPPMPVPSVMTARCDSPRPAPNRHSAHAAALASLSTITGRRSRADSLSVSGSCRHDRCGANSTLARAASTKPAAPMPTAATSWRATSSDTTSAMTRSTTSGLLVRSGVSARTVSSSVPSGVTTPATTLVPPMSTPTVSSGGSPRTPPVVTAARVGAGRTARRALLPPTSGVMDLPASGVP